jgi:hypothetical protein
MKRGRTDHVGWQNGANVTLLSFRHRTGKSGARCCWRHHFFGGGRHSFVGIVWHGGAARDAVRLTAAAAKCCALRADFASQ